MVGASLWQGIKIAIFMVASAGRFVRKAALVKSNDLTGATSSHLAGKCLTNLCDRASSERKTTAPTGRFRQAPLAALREEKRHEEAGPLATSFADGSTTARESPKPKTKARSHAPVTPP
jgi:hypothetical protein